MLSLQLLSVCIPQLSPFQPLWHLQLKPSLWRWHSPCLGLVHPAGHPSVKEKNRSIRSTTYLTFHLRVTQMDLPVYFSRYFAPIQNLITSTNIAFTNKPFPIFFYYNYQLSLLLTPHTIESCLRCIDLLLFRPNNRVIRNIWWVKK